ncbi:MAG: GNAT family N-acetyltransferase [Thermoguttaceae bacterium]|nr:GNAT family N-acetyltransferase [Thermoguttaceae bacterium]MDW8036641.1 GNAT family N-acetyltransferase [Thermoguttaceae bacterium]
MSNFPGPLWIGPVGPEDMKVAFMVVSEDLPPEVSQSLETAEPTSWEETRWMVRGAYRGDQLVGVQLAHLQAGRSAVVWPPRFLVQEGAEVGLALVEGVCQELASRGVQLVYCFLETDTGMESRLMQIAGFARLAQLLYLVSTEEDFPFYPPRSVLCFEPYCPQNHDRFLCTVTATYVESLDCPLFNQKRSIEDVLDSYKATGVYRPELWQLVRSGQEDVGCLLLNDHPELESFELVYMGLIPSARGKGWGVEVTRQAQWLTRLWGRNKLLLGVDAENWPAIRVYAAAGFRQWASRMVYGRFLS